MATTADDITRTQARPDQVLLTIDGQEVACEHGDTVLDAAQRVGIHIPTLCYEPRLPASAACRMCIVEVEGARKMVPSCTAAVSDGMVVRTNTDKVRAMRHLYLELLLSDHNSFCTPPCRDACPTHIKIPQFLEYIAHKDYKNGVRKLREDLPFPAVLGRVCPRPCEGPCRRQLIEHPITICQLHRFMADQTIDEEQEGELLLPVEPKPDSGKRIAIVGGGPAGLAAAFYARLEGHAVKIFEALPKPGGMLRYGIPSYRLPRDLLDKEINVLWRLGVEIQVNSRLGVDYQLEDLFDEGFDTVFLALGAFNSNDMGIPGEDAEGVVTAVDFLGDLELNGEVHVGNNVTVIGGGFTAMDACRTSVRKGAKEVTCLYRRSRKEMPAHHTEVDEAEEEGVKLELLCAPVRVLTDAANKVAGIEMLRMELGEPDASGRRRPVPVEGSEFIVECDQIIAAIGQYPKLDGTSEEQGVKRTKWRTIAVDDWTFQTADPRVFAGGDVVLGAQTAIQAVAQGKKAAWSIDAYLRGADMAEVGQSLAELKAQPFFNTLTSRTDLDPRVARMAEVPPVFIDMTTDVTRPSPPAEMPKCAPEDRRTNFKQIELGFSEEEAVRGAELCLDCYCPANGKCDLQRYGIEYEVFKNRFHGGGAHDYPADFRHDFIMREPNRCINCGRCVRVCGMEVGSSCYDNMGRGYDAIVSTADNLPLQLVGCVSCGKCAETCPTGSIETNPRLLGSYDLDESRCMFCGECVEVCPYDALEQSDFFELAGYNRTTMARESLYVREPRRVDPLRETVTDLVPHVRDAALGRGWTWEPIKDDPIALDEPEGGV
jgi:NADPH-dependent glutamate synthase beta subunit-like oxidoreductase/formate hydrogenlyase subunit 6/NADH:ubiquinone oxidoreductase subunit I/ferredoxin